MTENKIKLIGALAGAVLMVGFGFGMYGLATSCSPEDVPESVIEFYSDDSNYFTVIGQIVEYNDLKNIMRVSTGDIEYFCELPKNSVGMLRRNEFDFSVGGVYKFTIGNTYYGKIHVDYPIVAVHSVKGSIEYLSYDVGKANLIEIFSDSDEQ